jgi:multicomponent K+:H+ antiporter subunit A
VVRLAGLSWLFALLILGIGLLVILYSRYYMSPEDPVPRFFSFLLAFMGSMLGLVLSGNLIQLIFFWELTSIFSFLLIGYWHHNQSARDGARMSLIVTSTGGVCLLAGFVILGGIAGSYDLDRILGSAEAIRSHPQYLTALVLVLIGAFTKSAQFPFHFWLPQAMAAPTPVSAYLHSATMVKGGVFILALLWPVLSGTDAWFFIVGTIGLLSLLIGAWAAVFQQDLKGLLAYSTMSHLGLMTLLLGLGSPLGAVAAIFHMTNHAMFKASLFMAAGIIDHETGTRDLRRLSGLRRYLPITAALAMVAAAAMAGVPLLNGFLSKEMFLAEALEAHSGTILDLALPYVATIASAFGVLYSLRFIHQTFFGPAPEELPRTPEEPPRWMRFPIAVLVFMCLAVGLLPARTIGPILETAVLSVLGTRTPVYSLAIWHGFGAPMFMSMAALKGGAMLYWLFRDRLNAVTASPVIGRWRGRKAFEDVLDYLEAAAAWATSAFSTDRLQMQLRLLLGLAVTAGALPLIQLGFAQTFEQNLLIDPIFGIICFIGCVAALSAAVQAKFHRLAALVLVGVVGVSTCLIFLWLSAPDLAITQLLVEITTTFLLLLGLRWLPKRLPELYASKRVPFSVYLRRGLDVSLALALGVGAAVGAYAVMTRPAVDTISRYFLQRAYAQGGGTNVVNVILVDFRGFDTLGEITVLCIVGITVFALLRRFRPAPESMRVPEQQRLQNAFDADEPTRQFGDTLNDYLRVPGLIMQWLLPVVVTFAFYLLLRGHNLPGGGFAAGITMSIALIIQYMATGTRFTESRLNVQPLRWAGLGLLCSLFTGMGALLYGYPFLTSDHRYIALPMVGPIPLSTAMLFDMGVFVLVVGATVVILIALAHQSIRTHLAKSPTLADQSQPKD